MKTTIEQAIKCVRKNAENLKVDLKNIQSTRNVLPGLEQEAEALRDNTDVTNDEQLNALMRARARVEIYKRILETNPPKLEPTIIKTVDSIQALYSGLVDAANREREDLISSAADALAPFAGTEEINAKNGEKKNPARQIAETLPILDQVPSDVRGIPDVSSLRYYISDNGYERPATDAVEAAEAAVEMATQWIKRGCRFADRLK